MRNKSLAYLTTRVFWPTESGHEVHIYNYCKALHEQYGYDIDVFIIGDRARAESSLARKPSFLRNVVIGSDVRPPRVVANVLTKGLGRGAWPLQCLLYSSPANRRLLEQENQRQAYDVLFVDMVRLAPYLDSCTNRPPLAVLDMGDLLSKRYERQIESVSSSSNVGGALTDKLPGPLKKLVGSRKLQTAILRHESKTMARAELLWANRYDSIILVSPVETEELNTALGKAKAFTVRVGVDCEKLGATVARKASGVVSFMGDMRTAANSDTARYIVKRILPLCNNVKEMVFVGNAPEGLRSQCGSDSRVRFAGRVDDIREEIQRSNVFLAPLAYGTGVKIKIVEAMAMGMSVVTNEIGVEGIPASNGVDLLVGGSDREIASMVDDLLADDERCTSMGDNARSLAMSHFGWKATTKAFEEAGL